MIPEPKHAIPRAFEYLRAPQVVFAGVSMLPAIKLDDQTGFNTGEVGNEADYRVLAAEAQAKQLAVSQMTP